MGPPFYGYGLSTPLCVVAVVVLLPASALADTGPDSPFDDFPELEGPDAEARTALNPGDAPDLEEKSEEVSPPDEPVELRLNLEERVDYEVASRLQLSYGDRPDFEPEYRSGLTVQYRPVSQTRRRQLPGTPLEVGDTEEPQGGEGMMMTVTDFSGLFAHPSGLDHPARTHAPLRDARLSFRLGDRGQISDLRLHPPTNPTLRANAEEMMRLLTSMRPTLPEEAVQPGDDWTDTVSVQTGDEEVERSHELDIEYTFEDWTRCGPTHCAVLKAQYQLEATGTREVVHLRTDGEAAGTTTGRLLFAPASGRVVSSQWTTDVEGETTSVRPETPEEPVHDFEFELRVRTAMHLIDP